ncbi:MAG: DUF5668 domain-containing protein [Firmicutes bacterium]|nr:DUF5668 domain-containing protein [Bacillota bacterium]
MSHDKPTKGFTTKIVFGVLLVIFGGLLLLHNLRVVEVNQALRYWPLALVALGVARLISRGFLLGKGGHVLILLGVFFQLLILGREDIIDRWWPMAVVWMGLVITLRALWPTRKPLAVTPDSNESLS